VRAAGLCVVRFSTAHGGTPGYQRGNGTAGVCCSSAFVLRAKGRHVGKVPKVSEGGRPVCGEIFYRTRGYTGVPTGKRGGGG
jgi:hypothetical protein